MSGSTIQCIKVDMFCLTSHNACGILILTDSDGGTKYIGVWRRGVGQQDPRRRATKDYQGRARQRRRGLGSWCVENWAWIGKWSMAPSPVLPYLPLQLPATSG